MTNRTLLSVDYIYATHISLRKVTYGLRYLNMHVADPQHLIYTVTAQINQVAAYFTFHMLRYLCVSAHHILMRNSCIFVLAYCTISAYVQSSLYATNYRGSANASLLSHNTHHLRRWNTIAPVMPIRAQRRSLWRHRAPHP
jgi:hypothetical protein